MTLTQYRVRDLQNVAIELARHYLELRPRPTDEEIEQLLAVHFDFARTKADK